MDIKVHTSPSYLERYSFLWTEVRLVVAALSLIVGGYPIALRIIPIPLTGSLLVLCWVISGVASGYLGYRWYIGGQKLFGGSHMKDTVAFGVAVVSGINLGIVGLLGQNIGMSLLPSRIIFMFTGLVYLASAYWLYTKWKSHGEKVF